jgi:hypothetical protein
MILQTFTNQNDISDLPSLSEYNIETIYTIIKDSEYGYYYNILNKLSFPDNPDEQLFDYYVPNGKEGWTTISYKNYGTIKLWWLIADFNKIINPIDFPSPETKLKIPKPIVVRHILDKISNK